MVLPDDSKLQYLHPSEIDVVEGQQITPDTQLGVTGSTGAGNAIHLHVQAFGPDGKSIDPEDLINRVKQEETGCQ